MEAMSDKNTWIIKLEIAIRRAQRYIFKKRKKANSSSSSKARKVLGSEHTEEHLSRELIQL